MRLVADIGGTNTRLGLVVQGALQQDSVRSLPNDGFSGVEAVIDRFRSGAGTAKITEIVLAVAAPVTGRQARLTNRDWSIDADRIAARYGVGVRLINDLTALGHAVPMLSGELLQPVFAGSVAGGGAGQSLVVGIGTGFNVCPVINAGETVCFNAEMGLATMPTGVASALDALRPGLAPQFPTVEDLFSGRGFVRFCQLAGAPDGLTAAQIIDGYRTDARLAGAVEDYGGLLGWMLRDLMLAYMPMAGLYFAGGVARAVLSSGASAHCLKVLHRPLPMGVPTQCPIWIIGDDAAALHGCSQVTI